MKGGRRKNKVRKKKTEFDITRLGKKYRYKVKYSMIPVYELINFISCLNKSSLLWVRDFKKWKNTGLQLA